MPDFNTFRINEDLLGRIIASKRRDCQDPNYIPNKSAKIIGSTVVKNRPENYQIWFREIQKLAKNKGMTKISRVTNKNAAKVAKEKYYQVW